MARAKRIMFLIGRLKKSGTLTEKQRQDLCRYVPAALDELGNEGFRECSQNRTLEILNITKDTLKSWVSKGAPVKNVKGQNYYDPGDLMVWRWKYQQRLDQDNDQKRIDEEIQKENLKYKREQTLKLEVDRKKKLRQLIPAAESWSAWRTLAQILNNRLAPHIDQDIWNEIIYDAQDEFAKMIPQPDEDPGLYDQIINDGMCTARNNNGRPCQYKAKKDGLCLIHWNKLKGK